MTGHHGKVTKPHDVGPSIAATLCPTGTLQLSMAGRRRSGGSLSMVGMALGYFVLVIMLSVAPFWHQAMTPHQHQPHACTEFGGSR